MKKQKFVNGVIAIRDSKRTNPQGKIVPAYRVISRGRNGEPLQTSEVLNDTKAVITHIKAMTKLYGDNPLSATKIAFPTAILDETKSQKFAKGILQNNNSNDFVKH